MDLKCLLVPLIVVIAASAPGLIAAQPCAVECYPHSTVPVCRPPVAPRSACCAKSPLYPPPPPLVAPIIEPPRPLVWSCAPVPPPPGYAPMIPPAKTSAAKAPSAPRDAVRPYSLTR